MLKQVVSIVYYMAKLNCCPRYRSDRAILSGLTKKFMVLNSKIYIEQGITFEAEQAINRKEGYMTS
jgi:hypothetical protein